MVRTTSFTSGARPAAGTWCSTLQMIATSTDEGSSFVSVGPESTGWMFLMPSLFTRAFIAPTALALMSVASTLPPSPTTLASR